LRIIAYVHDTSVVEIERTYGRYLGNASDDARKGLLDDAVAPPADNVVTMSYNKGRITEEKDTMTMTRSHNLELVEAARARFRPDQIMTLFIGESAPDSDKFFYFGKNPMLTYTRKAIEQALGADGSDIAIASRRLAGISTICRSRRSNKLAPAMRKSACHAARRTLAERIAVYKRKRS